MTFALAAIARHSEIVQGKVGQGMLDFQSRFRLDVESTVSTALRLIGADLRPRASLIGFGADSTTQPRIWIEPETEPIAIADLSGVAGRLRAGYEAHDESGWPGTAAIGRANHQAWPEDQAQAIALCEALESSVNGKVKFFTGPPVQVGPYYVHVVISMASGPWAALPTLIMPEHDRMNLVSSFPEAVIRAILTAAARALGQRQPPWGLSIERLSDHHELVRSAAHRFVESIGIMTGQKFAPDLYEALDAVAAQSYEGRTGVGTIVFATRSSDRVEADIRFVSPVPIMSTRAFRKVLEMSGPDLHVLADGESAYGLGRVADAYESAAGDIFALTVAGHGSWELSHAGVPLLRVDNTRPTLPQARLLESHFARTVSWLFPEAKADDISSLWALAAGAAEQEHGTTLVIHRDAAREAARLLPQALIIEPTVLSDSTLHAITNIDGAVLVSPDARCHAVGVILDGRATGTGDPSRGARYNSAVRYLQSAGNNCLVIIVSEDGMINLLPDVDKGPHA